MLHVDDLAQRDARSHPRGIEVIHLDETLVADDESLAAVEVAQALRHVVDRGLEAEQLAMLRRRMQDAIIAVVEHRNSIGCVDEHSKRPLEV
jgi:hypothetical protein